LPSRYPPSFQLSIFTQAWNDAHIGFFTSYQQTFPLPQNEFTPGFYEIVIGGWSDTYSVVRDGGQGVNQDVAASDEGWLDIAAYTSFWACARDDVVSMGKGETVGENTISCYLFSGVGRTVQYVGFSTGFGSTGDWIDIKSQYEFGPDFCYA
jgi:Farnesoic acid 0-methyl transferase